jgi:hypothetical protein
MNTAQIRLVVPDTPELIEATREIFREYEASLSVDLCFQNFADELVALPGEYAEPAGALLLAYIDHELAGSVAMRPMLEADLPTAGGMKRLFVRLA